MLLRLRSALFLIWLLLLSLTMFTVCLPLLLFPRRIVVAAANLWAWAVLKGLKVTTGLGLEVRGEMPASQGVLVAAKHFSMWETVALTALLRDPAIVMKRELLRIPLYGWYTRKQEMNAIDRSAGASALRALHRASAAALAQNRPIVIFPEGTRKNPATRPITRPGSPASMPWRASPACRLRTIPGCSGRVSSSSPAPSCWNICRPSPPG